MAVRKKKTGILKNMNPTTAAVVGGAAGFGAAKLAVYAGEKIPEKMNVPEFMRKTNVGTHAAATLGVILTIFGKTPAVQGAGVGMIVTVIPEYVDMITDGNDGDDDDEAPTTRRTEMRDIEDVEAVEVEAPQNADTVQGGTPYFDVLQAIQSGENFGMYN